MRHKQAKPEFEQLVEGHEYRVLSLQPPWAWAIMFGGKDVENRSWATPYRGRILIHASTRKITGHELEKVRRDLSQCCGIPLSAVPAEFERRGILGSVELIDCVENARSPWAEPGALHWLLRDARPLATPVRGVNGRLQLWRWAVGRSEPLRDGEQVGGRAPEKAATENTQAAPTGDASGDDREESGEISVNEIMIAMRSAARSGPCEQRELLRRASRALGFARMGSRIEAALKHHLRTAVRRGVLARVGNLIDAPKRDMAAYDADALVEAIGGVLKRGQAASRAELTKAVHEHLGFSYDAVANDNASAAIDAACQRGMLTLDGSDRLKRIA